MDTFFDDFLDAFTGEDVLKQQQQQQQQQQEQQQQANDTSKSRAGNEWVSTFLCFYLYVI